MNDEYYIELARRLCAAFISQQRGIGLEYALKRYVPDQIGPYWIGLASVVASSATRSMDEQVVGPAKEEPTVQ